MLKRTIYFSRPAYLNLKDRQIVCTFKDEDETKQVPIEDLGYVIIDHPQITLTAALMGALSVENVALITCDDTHHPASLALPMDGHQVQQERYRLQLEATLPTKKRLWQQTITAKLVNQAKMLKLAGMECAPLIKWSAEVLSGDSNNLEARGSRFYWPQLFSKHYLDFRRDRFGYPPNNALNYGYAILRAACARALVGSGLLPALGIHHRNRYNAYCLADDIMEPYRPFVDKVVYQLIDEGIDLSELSRDVKSRLLQVLADDVRFKKHTSPLMIGLSETTTSLFKVYGGESDKLVYPSLI